MADIIQKGHPTLRARANAVPPEDITGERIQNILQEMDTTLSHEPDGVALAAPQIDIPLRIFVVSKKAWNVYLNQPRFYINPTIIKHSKKTHTLDEGCLSVRWLYGKTERYRQVTVQAYNEHGEQFTAGSGGLLAQIFQHEIDHLNGILFCDHATELQQLSEEEVQRLKEQADE